MGGLDERHCLPSVVDGSDEQIVFTGGKDLRFAIGLAKASGNQLPLSSNYHPRPEASWPDREITMEPRRRVEVLAVVAIKQQVAIRRRALRAPMPRGSSPPVPSRLSYASRYQTGPQR